MSALNLGVRYDLDLNGLDATRLVLEAIGNPYGGLPGTPKQNISPRVGFAYAHVAFNSMSALVPFSCV